MPPSSGSVESLSLPRSICLGGRCDPAVIHGSFCESFSSRLAAYVARFGCESRATVENRRAEGAYASICTPNGTNRKQSVRTKACDESSITAACYLCNTLPKTARLAPFQAVPLLRVHLPSVIVMLRRRGASRGRPVLGGSLKSLAFMRECPKARSG